MSALLTEGSGLLTNDSFATNTQGDQLSFPYLDCVVIVSHLHQLMRATKEEPFLDYCLHAFDYGKRELIPYKAFIPLSDAIPEDILDCLQVYLPSPTMGAEYVPADLIWWIGNNES